LPSGHRTGATVGQKIDCDIFGVEQKNIVVRGCQPGFALVSRGNRQCFGHLDAKWLNDRMHETVSFKFRRTEAGALGSKSQMGARRTFVYKAEAARIG